MESAASEEAVLYSERNHANRVRELLRLAGSGQRAAAKALEIGDRTMRGYCSGHKVPGVVMLALERLVDMGRHID